MGVIITAFARFADSKRDSKTSSAVVGTDALTDDGCTAIRYLEPPTDDRLNWIGKFEAGLLSVALSKRRFMRRRSEKRPDEASFSDGLLIGLLPQPSPHSGDRSGDEDESTEDKLTASSLASSSSSSSSSDESASVVVLLLGCKVLFSLDCYVLNAVFMVHDGGKECEK